MGLWISDFLFDNQKFEMPDRFVPSFWKETPVTFLWPQFELWFEILTATPSQKQSFFRASTYIHLSSCQPPDRPLVPLLVLLFVSSLDPWANGKIHTLYSLQLIELWTRSLIVRTGKPHNRISKRWKCTRLEIHDLSLPMPSYRILFFSTLSNDSSLSVCCPFMVFHFLLSISALPHKYMSGSGGLVFVYFLGIFLGSSCFLCFLSPVLLLPVLFCIVCFFVYWIIFTSPVLSVLIVFTCVSSASVPLHCLCPALPSCWSVLFIPCVSSTLFLCSLETSVKFCSFGYHEGLLLVTPASPSPAFGSSTPQNMCFYSNVLICKN